MLLSLALRASVVLGANKERHWDLLDLRDVDEWRDFLDDLEKCIEVK